MKKIIVLLGMIFVAVMIGVLVSASPVAPNPFCKINSKIINVTYIAEYFQEDNGMPCNEGGRNVSASYLLNVKINEISTVTEAGDSSCDELYPLNSEQTLTILKSEIKSGDVFQKNQIIEGNIHMTGDECGGGIYLSDYEVIDEASCNQDSDCVLKDKPYCCGYKVEYYKSCYQTNETPKEVNCTSPAPCPGIAQVDYCECENNKCVGKENSSNPNCKNYYWIDNDNKNCSQKQFCGTYMYLGLQTFASKTQCLKALNDEITEVLVTDEDFLKDEYTFKSIKINEDILELGISYSGGCKNHSFNLIWGGDFLESLPVQVNLYLSHNANNDSCEALIMKTLQFDLTPIKEVYQNTYPNSASNEIVINFYDSDNTKHQITYNLVDETSCETDDDCACGVHITTGECFVGNNNYVDTDPAKQCPDFCTGFGGNLRTRCVKNKCSTIDPSRSLCDKKEDCKVIFNKCTCKYQCERIGQNYTETVCDKYECSEDSKNKNYVSCECDNNVCVESKNKFCDEGTLDGKCYKNLNNGRKAEIKIMPETASATAIERLGDLGFTIELKEVGKGNETRVVYELTGNKQGKFLGIFKIMARVQAQVDAEDGSVKVIKPWWAFLARGV